MGKISAFFVSKDGLILASWALISLVLGLSLATGPFPLADQLMYLALTLGFGAFLVYALVLQSKKIPPLPSAVMAAEDHRRAK